MLKTSRPSSKLSFYLIPTLCLSSIFLSGISGCPTQDDDDTTPPYWDSGLEVSKILAQDSTTLYSSTSLYATWNESTNATSYKITAISSFGLSTEWTTTDTSLTMKDLFSSTEYTFSIKACLNEACSSYNDGGSKSETTPEETWKILSTNSKAGFENALHIVSDGNTKPDIVKYGSDAPSNLANKIQLYYDPSKAEEKGIKIGTSSVKISTDPKTYTSFTPLSGYGFLRKDDPNTGENIGPSTFQVVPLSSSMGSKIRLFFEGEITGQSSVQLYYIDSQDGYQGWDFNPSTATQCSSSETSLTGTCKVSLAVGASAEGNLGIESARQAKVIYPSRSDWRWDGAIGTAMFVTAHLEPDYYDCSSIFFNAGYAIWDGSKWNLQYDQSTGCPLLIPEVQAPYPVHLGGTRYALYFSHNQSNTSNSKPFEVIYGDSTLTGDPDILEFEDWETIDKARTVNFTWEDGTALSDTDKSKLDDFSVFYPSATSDQKSIFSNMSSPCVSGQTTPCGAFIGAGILLN